MVRNRESCTVSYLNEVLKLNHYFQVELDNNEASFRRKLVRTLKRSRGSTLTTQVFKCDIWGHTINKGAEGENTNWAKDEKGRCMRRMSYVTPLTSVAGQINEGFRKLCRVEVEVGDWMGTLTQKYVRNKPKDSIELDLVIEQDELCYRAYIEWKEGVSLLKRTVNDITKISVDSQWVKEHLRQSKPSLLE
jgi:hypothetical protein